MNEKRMMTDAERRFAAKQFAADWQGRGDEKQETQTFWLTLLQKVYGVVEPEKFISFEKTVNVDDAKTGKTTTRASRPSTTRRSCGFSTRTSERTGAGR